MEKLSIVIITKNEERYIYDAVKSAIFADEVIILDSNSIDKTCEIAQKLGAKIYKQEWLGYGKQKNKAIELSTNDWIFVLDSDERITPSLKNEILKVLNDPQYDGYRIARLNNFFGKDIKTCGLYPDYSIRLFNRKKGVFNNLEVHESVQISGKVSKLKHHMKHLAYDSVEDFISKQKKYASLSQKNKSFLKAIFSPIWIFFKIYLVKAGILDGWRGFVIAKVYSQYTYWKYRK